MRIDFIEKEQWDVISLDSHTAIFNEKRPVMMNRIDYALGLAHEDRVIGFITVRELDHESDYWQYGGVLPEFRGTPFSFKIYCKALEWSFQKGTKHITTAIENTNTPMLRFALRVGYLIIGTKTFDGKVYVDLMLEQENFKGLKGG